MNRCFIGDCRDTIRDLIAQRLGRQWIGCEIQEGYSQMQIDRTAQTALPL